MTYHISKKDKNIVGTIRLDGSKSISNRVLIIQALCDTHFPIQHLSTSNDTTTLKQLLSSDESVLDAGAAGTTFRFMTAYLALQKGSQILTGSERMKQRPIGKLVDALRDLGANIEYLEKEGYPPLKIGTSSLDKTNTVRISANISSQFISALLLIAPTLPQGLRLVLEGKIVSRSYIEMTLNLMAQFGIQHEWNEQTITILPQNYQAKDFAVEADWSAASYYYAIAAFSDFLDLKLLGVSLDSVQGDVALAQIYKALHIKTTAIPGGISLSKINQELPSKIEWDFSNCPDIAQTLAATCAGLGIQGDFSGLSTLKIKETDRLVALKSEFKQLDVELIELDNSNSCTVQGLAKVNQPIFHTYEDHRMAMSLAPLAMFGDITIHEPMVVKKSYPNFYKDLEKLGFDVVR